MPNLTLYEDDTSVGQVDTPEDVDSPHVISLGTDISDPRILILSSAIKNTLSTYLSELNNTISLLATTFQTVSQTFSTMQSSPRYREGAGSITAAASAFDRSTACTGITQLTQQSGHESAADEEDQEVGSDQHGIPDSGFWE